GRPEHPPRQPRRRVRHPDRPAPARRGGHAMNDATAPRRYWPLGQLTLARLRGFYREPEALFWVYGFPILMVVALGIAFRNKPVERIAVDVEEAAGGAATTTDLVRTALTR